MLDMICGPGRAGSGDARRVLLVLSIFAAVSAGFGGWAVHVIDGSAVVGRQSDRDLWKDRALARTYASLPMPASPPAASFDASALKLRTFLFPTVHVGRVASEKPPTHAKIKAARPSAPTKVATNVVGPRQLSFDASHVGGIGEPPRSLGDDLKLKILTQLSKSKPIEVQALTGDVESLHFATQIMHFLLANGFSVIAQYPSQVAFNGPVTGLHVVDQGDHQAFIVASRSPTEP